MKFKSLSIRRENSMNSRNSDSASGPALFSHPKTLNKCTSDGRSNIISTINTSPSEDCFLTTEEAAEYLRISTASLRNLTSSGKITYYKFFGRNRFLLSELKELVLSQKRGPIHGD
jgi:excisionase family DNA binding protein